MARRKQYGNTWWGGAWIDALNRIDYNTNRLPRGRSYANGGRVEAIKIDDAGCIKARVQGRRSRPYRVIINLTRFTADQNRTVKSIIARDPALAAELSLGRLPESILERLDKEGLQLLPESWSDISGECSCPDWANPCKHLAAVYYIIAGEIDKDPLILFKLRGLETGKLLEAAGFMASGGSSLPAGNRLHVAGNRAG